MSVTVGQAVLSDIGFPIWWYRLGRLDIYVAGYP